MYSENNKVPSIHDISKRSLNPRRKMGDINRKNIWNGLSQTTLGFCYSTSLHGLRHLANDFEEMNEPQNQINTPRR